MYSKGQVGSFTFEIDEKSQREEFSTLKKTIRGGTRRTEVDEVQIEKSYYDALWEERYEELECTPCNASFRRDPD